MKKICFLALGLFFNLAANAIGPALQNHLKNFPKLSADTTNVNNEEVTILSIDYDDDSTHKPMRIIADDAYLSQVNLNQYSMAVGQYDITDYIEYDPNNIPNLAVLGNGKFHDDLLGRLYSRQKVDYNLVVLESQNQDYKDMYAVGPYGTSHPYYNEFNSKVESVINNYNIMVLDAQDSDYVYFQPCDTRFKITFTQGRKTYTERVYVVSAAWVASCYDDFDLEFYAPLFGVREENEIFFPCYSRNMPTVWYTTSTLCKNKKFYHTGTDGLYGLKLPTYTETHDEYNAIKLSHHSFCQKPGQIIIDAEYGKSINWFGLGFNSKLIEERAYDEIDNQEIVYSPDRENGWISMVESDLSPFDLDDRNHFWYVIGYDKYYRPRSTQYIEVFAHPNAEDDNWLPGYYANYTDDVVLPMYGHDVKTHVVRIQEHKDRQGYFRIDNPYEVDRGEWTHKEHNINDCDHQHYIYINATDPTAVVLESSPLGLEYEAEEGVPVFLKPGQHRAPAEGATTYGEAMISSTAHEAMKYEGKTLAEVKEAGMTGTYNTETKTFSFPKNQILYAEMNRDNGTWQTANNNGQFGVTITNVTTGIESVATAPADSNAPVEYYDLQGRRITTPAAGQLTLRRQGNSVTKVVR